MKKLFARIHHIVNYLIALLPVNRLAAVREFYAAALDDHENLKIQHESLEYELGQLDKQVERLTNLANMYRTEALYYRESSDFLGRYNAMRNEEEETWSTEVTKRYPTEMENTNLSYDEEYLDWILRQKAGEDRLYRLWVEQELGYDTYDLCLGDLIPTEEPDLNKVPWEE